MASGGLSKARLGRLHEVMNGYVERGEVAGSITVVDRRDETHMDFVGLADRERNVPLASDTIMRIMSMSKPITAAATMILVEECKLRLDEPVERLLPELANRKVLRQIDGPLDDTVPANRPIRVRDLLTFTLGFGMAMMLRPDAPIQKAQTERRVGFGAAGPDAWIKSFGELPLMYQPGERWLYHTGSDILGVLIARAAGMSFESFLNERIFEPLGMKDTGFHVPANKLDRLAAGYAPNPQTRELALNDDPRNSRYAKPPAFASGGAGLLSTADDYLAFARMMLGGGKLGKQRILSRSTVEAMITDQLTPAQKAASASLNSWETRGYGFGVGIVTKRTSGPDSPGRFGWDGAYGTYWNSDPREEMTVILLTQRFGMAGPPISIGQDYLTLAYQAIDD
jgi:CubicO group peptidase (beta-lactamase class C family)